MHYFSQTFWTKYLTIVLALIFLVQKSLTQFAGLPVSQVFGLVPAQFWSGHIYQVWTYQFLHGDLIHLLFNCLALAFLGAELEIRWGRKFYALFFSGCVVGGGLIYAAVMPLISGAASVIPVVGASGGIFGLLVAYAILFGERQMLFMFIFPMKAKWFCALLAGIQLFIIVFETNSSTAAVAHLGGLVTGYVILVWEARRRRNQNKPPKSGSSGGWGAPRSFRKSSHLRVVVNNRKTH